MAGSAKRVIGTVLFLVALVATAFFVFLLFADAENIDSVPGTGEVPAVALITAILLGVVLLLLILILVIRRWDRQHEDAEDAEAFYVPEQYRPGAPTGVGKPVQPLERGAVVVYDLASVPIDTRAWAGPEQGNIHVFHFPRFANRSVYINDYVDIGPGMRLKLRTLLAGPPGAFRNTFESEPARPASSTQPRLNGQAEWGSMREEIIGAPSSGAASSGGRPGGDFMAELERIYEARNAAPARSGLFLEGVEEKMEVASEFYYDYQGDSHEVIDIEGIGPVYADKLRNAGIHTTSRLCFESPQHIASVCDVAVKTAEGWKAQAELIKVSGIGPQYAEVLARAGIAGIQELKNRSSKAISDQINEYLGTIDTNVQGNTITPKRVEGWQEAAKPMRRVRTKVPEN